MANQGPPRILDINESRQGEIYASALITFIIAVVTVVLRFASRIIAKSGFWVDDYLMAGALVIISAYLGVMVLAIDAGNGRHVGYFGQNGLQKTSEFFRTLFIEEILYFLGIACVKYSILAFYWRIFRVKSVKMPICILSAVVTAWWIAMVLITILQCQPASGFWNRVTVPPPKCGVDSVSFFIGNSIPNIVTDIALLALPMPYTFKLHRNIPQRAALTGLFLLGGFVCIISIVRLVQLVKLDLQDLDVLWNFTDTSIWTQVELFTAVISACLPSLRPVVALILPSFIHSSARGSTPKGHSKANTYQNLGSSQKARGVYGKPNADLFSDREGLVQGGNYAELSIPSSEMELGKLTPGKISVRNDVDIQWDQRHNVV